MLRKCISLNADESIGSFVSDSRKVIGIPSALAFPSIIKTMTHFQRTLVNISIF